MKTIKVKPLTIIDYLRSKYGVKIFNVPVVSCKSREEMERIYEVLKLAFPLAYETKKLSMYIKDKELSELDEALFLGL